MKYEKNSIVYLVESNRYIRKAVVHRVTGDFYVVRFYDNGGAIQVREKRLFSTEDAARASITQDLKIRTGYRSPYEYGH